MTSQFDDVTVTTIVKDSVNSTCKLIDMTEKQVQRPKTKNTENVADENRSYPCGCWCAWYSKEEDGRKHQESIVESYCDRDSKDLLAGVCTNPQEGAYCMNRMTDLSD